MLGVDSSCFMSLRFALSLLGIVACSACTAGMPSARTLLDLTHPFDEHTIYWPKNRPFERQDTSRGLNAQGRWYASGEFAASEHGGTHIDAPIHFASTGYSVDEIPISQLFGPALVIDIRAQCRDNPDYELAQKDINEWEMRHGPIEQNDLVLLLTGWGTFWPNKKRYLGSQTPDDPGSLHFPGFSAEAMTFLVKDRRIRGVGIDTASIDPGRSVDFPAHRILSEANGFALENVAQLERLPIRGAMLAAFPLKIAGGTGGPIRLVAFLP